MLTTITSKRAARVKETGEACCMNCGKVSQLAWSSGFNYAQMFALATCPQCGNKFTLFYQQTPTTEQQTTTKANHESTDPRP